MIKKLTILFLAVFYLNVSSGIGIQFHYCMGQLVSWAIGHQEDDHHTCDRCGMDVKNSSCCKDELVILKLNESHQPGSFVSGISTYTGTLPAIIPGEQRNLLLSACQPAVFYAADKNPDPPSLSRYLAIRVLRI